MEDARQQLVDRLKTANNILVTVSRDPSVDQLAALLGLGLLLNKQGKHAAAVFSGKVPSTLEFLKPEETFQKTTDSLRDFIIALDKNKADKLRYKVEDNFVRIFITPYRTSISQEDLDFSQGDFNVDLVIALGVTSQEDLDEAIVAHGRILHDATVASINTAGDGGLGTINWHSPASSSLSELVTSLSQDLEGVVLDEQISTALLTGIVAETDRFSNEKTSSTTMSVGAILMAAGANQQLVASKLDGSVSVDTSAEGATAESDTTNSDNDGALDIEHEESESNPETPAEREQAIELPNPDESPSESTPEPEPELDDNPSHGGSKLVTEPPTMGGTLTANSSEPKLDPVTDPLSMPEAEDAQLLERKPSPLTPDEPVDQPAQDQPTDQPADLPTDSSADVPQEGEEVDIPEFVPPPDSWHPPESPHMPPAPPVSDDNMPPTDADAPPQPDPNQTLTEIEQSVQSPHLQEGGLDAARDEVSRALTQSSGGSLPPIQALNAQPMDINPDPSTESSIAPASPFDSTADDSSSAAAPSPSVASPVAPQVIDPNAPPPVPPPIPFQFGGTPPKDNQ